LKRAAIFDIGSVSVKMLVAEADGNGGFSPLIERARVTRLGEGLAGRPDFLPVAAERTLRALEEFAAEAAGLGVERMEALGTEALRRVADARPFAAELSRLTGVTLEILDAASEARLAYRSGRALVEDGDAPLCTLDVGGGSTEILSGEGALPVGRALLPIGALRLKEACVGCEPPGEAEVACMVRTVAEASSGRFATVACSRLVGMAIAEEREWNKTLWLWELHVEPDCQGQGIGTKLVHGLVKLAGQHGCRVIACETQNTNVPAIRFYRKMGFEIDGLDLSYYTNSDATDYEVALFMKKKL